MGRIRVTAELNRRYLLARARLGPVAAAEECGISRTTGNVLWRAHVAAEAERRRLDPDPRSYADLDADARRGVDDFIFFAEHFLGLWTAPFWLLVASYLSLNITRRRSDDFNRILLTFHPGAGKTTLLLAYIVWRITRERALGNVSFAATYGSRTTKQARRGMREMKRWMRLPALIQSYGRYVPTSLDGEMSWTATEISVAGMDPGKDATFAIWSVGESVSGIRPHLAVWDDVVDEKNCTSEQTDALEYVWNGTLEHRVEPGGVLAVSGVYWMRDDLYHRLKARVYVEDDGTESVVWRHFRFMAHNEALCPGDGTHPQYHPATPGIPGRISTARVVEVDDKPVRRGDPGCEAAPATPERGCLLNPARWSYRALMLFAQNDPALFEMQYQGNDEDSPDALVLRSWWSGGVGGQGETCPGVLNRNRSVWCWPERFDSVVASLDPSPTQFIGAGIYAWDRAAARTYVIDLERRRMAPDEYPDFIEAWTAMIRVTVPGFCHWVIERTGAIYLLDNEPMQARMRRLGIQLIEHDTGRDAHQKMAEFGVWGLVPPEIHFGRLDVPYQTPYDRSRMDQFGKELMAYPQGRTNDLVMQFWMYLAKRRHLVVGGSRRQPKRWAPSWVRELNPAAVGIGPLTAGAR